jgi:nitrate/TMAO reductase-like tetraheme cytochrome c subunit
MAGIVDEVSMQDIRKYVIQCEMAGVVDEEIKKAPTSFKKRFVGAVNARRRLKKTDVVNCRRCHGRKHGMNDWRRHGRTHLADISCLFVVYSNKKNRK